jgi:general L-amino acid transport system permease protein
MYPISAERAERAAVRRVDLGRVRAFAWQAAVLALVAVAVGLVVAQTAANLKARGIASGFEYLGRAAGFEIPRGLVPYSSRDTYTRALLLGLVNTLRVTFIGIVIATVLGVAIGIARLSTLWVMSTLSSAYVEVMRNTPLLLQLMFWYALSQGLPGPYQALRPLPGVFVCNRGVFFPSIVWRAGFVHLDRPLLGAFNFEGGGSISPEFAALLIGLSIYTAAFIGEIVRGGILAVAALGLSRGLTLRLVVLPQALRLMVPPLTSQFLNLLKNSSLAVAIGYPDLISITDTTVNITGQAIEAIALATAVYLAIGLLISLGMNVYDGTRAPIGRAAPQP